MGSGINRAVDHGRGRYELPRTEISPAGSQCVIHLIFGPKPYRDRHI